MGRTLAVGRSVGEDDTSLIHCLRIDAQTAKVRVLDAVGMVATPTLQLNVQPKIPTAHLLHLMEAGRAIPKLAPEAGQLAADESLAVLVARWFVAALERVLEHGLASDYVLHRDEITTVRGRLALVETAQLIASGHLAVVAEFEELDLDTPLNRLLQHAARIIVGESRFPEELRQRALRATTRIEGVGSYLAADRDVSIDRRTAFYDEALVLARQIVDGSGRTLEAGGEWTRTFLIRTPGPVEDGLMATVRRALSPLKIEKAACVLPDAGLRITPDLVLDNGVGIADVKYKIAGKRWRRSDLYQAVAFAVGFGASRAAIVDFSPAGASTLSDVVFGDVRVRHVTWPYGAAVAPADAAREVADQLRAWLES